MKTKTVLFFFILMMITAIACSLSPVREITPAELNKVMNDSIILIDVRTPEEYNSGRIGNAVNINWHDETFMKSMEQFDKDQPIYLYCRSGSRSSQAAYKLKEAGYRHIYSLKGGISSYYNQ